MMPLQGSFDAAGVFYSTWGNATGPGNYASQYGVWKLSADATTWTSICLRPARDSSPASAPIHGSRAMSWSAPCCAGGPATKSIAPPMAATPGPPPCAPVPVTRQFPLGQPHAALDDRHRHRSPQLQPRHFQHRLRTLSNHQPRRLRHRPHLDVFQRRPRGKRPARTPQPDRRATSCQRHRRLHRLPPRQPRPIAAAWRAQPGSGSTSVITGADLAPSKMIRQNSGTTLYSQDAAAHGQHFRQRPPRSSTATTASSSPPTASACSGARQIRQPMFPLTTARAGRSPPAPSRSSSRAAPRPSASSPVRQASPAPPMLPAATPVSTHLRPSPSTPPESVTSRTPRTTPSAASSPTAASTPWPAGRAFPAPPMPPALPPVSTHPPASRWTPPKMFTCQTPATTPSAKSPARAWSPPSPAALAIRLHRCHRSQRPFQLPRRSRRGRRRKRVRLRCGKPHPPENHLRRSRHHRRRHARILRHHQCDRHRRPLQLARGHHPRQHGKSLRRGHGQPRDPENHLRGVVTTLPVWPVQRITDATGAQRDSTTHREWPQTARATSMWPIPATASSAGSPAPESSPRWQAPPPPPAPQAARDPRRDSMRRQASLRMPIECLRGRHGKPWHPPHHRLFTLTPLADRVNSTSFVSLGRHQTPLQQHGRRGQLRGCRYRPELRDRSLPHCAGSNRPHLGPRGRQRAVPKHGFWRPSRSSPPSRGPSVRLRQTAPNGTYPPSSSGEKSTMWSVFTGVRTREPRGHASTRMRSIRLSTTLPTHGSTDASILPPAGGA